MKENINNISNIWSTNRAGITDNIDNKENPPKIHFEVIGCRLNQIETQMLIALSKDLFPGEAIAPYAPVTASSPVDYTVGRCIVNTCAVTKKAETKCRHTIKLLLSHFPNAMIVVMGCYAAIKKSEIEKIDTRIKVLTMDEKKRLLEGEKDFFYTISSPSNSTSKSRAAIKIEDGCDNNCTYCVIHIARGPSTSTPLERVLLECKELERVGYNEIVFTGVNLAQYNSGGAGLSDLLSACIKKTNRVHFRLSSIYSEIIDDNFLSVIKSPRVASYFHLSVQSGSDRVLKDMNRAYSRSVVIKSCAALRQRKGDPFISCDIIAGFPTESDEDFLDTMALLKECDFSFVHAFPFSPREGTAAFSMKELEHDTLKKRMEILTAFALQQKDLYIARQVGKEFFSIIEVRKNAITCVTDNYLHCKILNGNDFSITNGAAALVRIESIILSGGLNAGKVSDLDSTASIVRLL